MKSKYSKYTDRELLLLSRSAGRQADAACSELFARYADQVYRFCVYMTDDDDAAEDIFQSAFIKSVEKINIEAQEMNFRSYLFTAARNLCINHRRADKYIYNYDFTKIPTHDHDRMDDLELYDLVIASLDLLDTKYREAFILREIEGMSYREMGEMLGITWSGAQSRVIRAREKLLAVLEPYIKDLN
ncbi:MAG: RNA polymerase sigma factor [Candidatus Kapaibacterium sp.]